VRTLIGPLPGIIVRHFLAHRFLPPLKAKAAMDKRVPRRNETSDLSLNPGSAAWSCLMRKSIRTPSIVPSEGDRDIYLVEDDLDELGRIWPEAEAVATDFETVVTDLLSGQYKNPQRVVAFNVMKGWSRDASADVAHELRRRCDLQLRDIPGPLQPFVDRQEGRYADVQLPLPMRLF
jgi:hypothetical protein